jgi:hypothetical protein
VGGGGGGGGGKLVSCQINVKQKIKELLLVEPKLGKNPNM